MNEKEMKGWHIAGGLFQRRHALHAALRSDDLGVFEAGREREVFLSYGGTGV